MSSALSVTADHLGTPSIVWPARERVRPEARKGRDEHLADIVRQVSTTGYWAAELRNSEGRAHGFRAYQADTADDQRRAVRECREGLNLLP